MKSTKRLFLLATGFFFIQTANAQISSADSMIHKIFSTLKAKDEKAFVALYPNAAQFGKMMRTMMTQMLNSEQMKQMMAMDEKSKNMNFDSLIKAEVNKLSKPEAFAEMEKSFAKGFQKLIEKGENKGVVWSNATLEKYTVDSASFDSEDMEMFKGTGIKNMKGVIDFRVGDSAYHMSFDKIIFLPSEGGWFGGEFPQLARKGESLEPEKELTSPDVMMPVDTTMYNPSETKTKSKTKTSPGKTKTKTKTKTPARKTGTKS